MTALGFLVEPEVNRNLVMVPGWVACIAVSIAGVGSVAISSLSGVTARPSSVPLLITTSTSGATVAAMALA
jgi:hypothetical protein